MVFEKLASAIRNNVISGLQGYHTNTSFTKEQIMDDIVDMRLSIMDQYAQAGRLPVQDLVLSANCVPIDCKDIEKCSKCSETYGGTFTAHFEIPQIYFAGGTNTIIYIGSTDKQNPFKVYSSLKASTVQKYKRKKSFKPYIWIDTTPNENGMFDGYVFNAPLLKAISIIAIFKDPRQLEMFGCCDEINDDNFSSINMEIKTKLTEHYLRYYRQGAMPPLPNDQKMNA